MKTWIRPREEGLVRYVAENMQAADANEIYALRPNDDPESVVQQVLRGVGYGWVLGHGTQPCTVIGIEPMWPGVWAAWMFSTANMQRAGRAVTKLARRVILPVWAEEGGHRLECWSHDQHTVAHRWLEALGARPEQTANGYGKGGETFLCYAWRR